VSHLISRRERSEELLDGGSGNGHGAVTGGAGDPTANVQSIVTAGAGTGKIGA